MTTRYYTNGKEISEAEYLLIGLPRFLERLNNQSHMIALLLVMQVIQALMLNLFLLGVL